MGPGEEKNEQIVREEVRAAEPVHAEAEQQNVNAVAPAVPVEAEREADPLEANIHILKETEEFVELNIPLLHADTVFQKKTSNLYRQQDQEKIRESSKKLGRKKAAADQLSSDQGQKKELYRRLNDAAKEKSDSDRIVETAILTNNVSWLDKAPPREDVTGYARRKNERSFANSAESEKAQRSARKDVDNLVNNLLHDVSLESDTSIPESLMEYVDAYYFTQKYGEKTKKKMEMVHRAAKRSGMLTEAQIEEEKKILAKLGQFTTIQKSYGSNFVPNMCGKLQEIRAHKLARQQILDEGNSAYHQKMVQLLDEAIAEKEREYDNYETNMRTFNGTIIRPRGAMQSEKQTELAQLRRSMMEPGLTDEQKAEIERRAEDIFYDYNYEGEVDTLESL